MGTGIFESLSKALDDSLLMTKKIMVGCVGLFLLAIFLVF